MDWRRIVLRRLLQNVVSNSSVHLQMHTANMNYQLPVYLTQAVHNPVMVLRGERPSRRYTGIRDDKGQSRQEDKHGGIPCNEQGREEMDADSFHQVIPVYNVAQTNLAEAHREDAHGQIQGSGT